MRSNSKKTTTPSAAALLGQRAAKVVDVATGAIVFGVIVDELKEHEQWQVVYYNDTMELLRRDQVLAVIALAKAHEHELLQTVTPGGGEMDEVTSDPKLILHGKRKRTQVNYRELNDAMFAGKVDSDEEAEDAGGAGTVSGAYVDDDEEEDEDYDPEEEEKKLRKAANDGEPADANATGKRSRRERKSVDYHALNEGLLSY